MRPSQIAWLAAALMFACKGSKTSNGEQQAVGTFIGGGSMLTGPDRCSYEGDPTVFLTSGPSASAKSGPRFVLAPGKIVVTCGETKREITAIIPTGARIIGPQKVKKGATSESFSATLVANDRPLNGDASVSWLLGDDCEGIARFGDVLGAQDTGGPDRTRTLVATGPGKCTVIVMLTTGSALEPSFAPKAFQAETLVTIE